MVLRLPVKNDFITGFINFMTFKISNNEDVMSAQKIIVKFKELMDAKKINFIFDSFSVDPTTTNKRYRFGVRIDKDKFNNSIIDDPTLIYIINIIVLPIYVIDESNADVYKVMETTITINDFKLTIDDKELVDNSDNIIQYVSDDTVLVRSFNNSWKERQLVVPDKYKGIMNNLFVWWSFKSGNLDITDYSPIDCIPIGKITLDGNKIVDIINLEIPLIFVNNSILVVQGGKLENFEWNADQWQLRNHLKGYYYVSVWPPDDKKTRIVLREQRKVNKSYLILGLIEIDKYGKVSYCINYDFSKDGLISVPVKNTNYIVVHHGSGKIDGVEIQWKTQRYCNFNSTNCWLYVAINKKGVVEVNIEAFDKNTHFTIGLVKKHCDGYDVSYDTEPIIRKKDNDNVTVRAGSNVINGYTRTWKSTDLSVKSNHYAKFYINYSVEFDTMTLSSEPIKSKEFCTFGYVIVGKDGIIHIHNGTDDPIVDRKGYICKGSVNKVVVEGGNINRDNRIIKWNKDTYLGLVKNPKTLVVVYAQSCTCIQFIAGMK